MKQKIQKKNNSIITKTIPASKGTLPAFVTDDWWLDSVSDDGVTWAVKENTASGVKTDKLHFDWKLHDGSRFSEDQNKHWLLTAQAYAKVYRLIVPGASIDVHKQRVYCLMNFFYWLRMLNVKSLQSVTKDHVEIYSEESALGYDYALRMHVRLYEYLVKTISDGQLFPIHPRSKLIDRTKVFESARLIRYETSPLGSHMCSEILNWFEKNGKEKASILSVDEILKEQKYENTVLTFQSLHRALMPIEELWMWRGYLPTINIEFDPFFHGSSKVAHRLGVPSERHPTIPPRLAISFISDSLRWVLDFAPHIIEALKAEDIYKNLSVKLQEFGFAIWVGDTTYSTAGRISVRKLLGILSAACFVVIASLTARRLNEISDIGFGSISKDVDGQHWLRVYIEKTSQRYDQIPIPVSVVKAIGVMEDLSKSARTKENDTIWQFLVDEEMSQIDPGDYLKDLAELCQTCKKHEIEWSFTAHQFRRFFAILYFWQYEKGDLAGLSHHLRHFSLEMTKRYVTDSDFGKVLKAVESEWQAEFLRSVIDGSRQIGGKAGNRLKLESKKLLNRFRKSVEVVAPKRTLQHLQRLSKKLGSEYKQHVWGTICACPSNTKFSSHARCKGASETGPIYKNANEHHCSNCPFAIHTERFASCMEEGLAAREKNVEFVQDGAMLSEIMNVQILSLQNSLSKADTTPLLLGMELKNDE